MAINCQNVNDLYDFGDSLGSGQFGTVRKCQEKQTQKWFAAKFIRVRRSRSSPWGVEKNEVQREVAILQEMRHPNIVAMHDVFESRTEIVLILELVTGGELFDYVAEKESLSEEEAMDFIVQLLQAVGYLHTNHILHLDLKPENILLRDQGTDRPHIKVIDFGLAQKVQPGAEIRSLGGTPQYIAPEVVNFEPLGPPADMWSIGVITYILLSGFSPFQGDTDNDTLTNIVELNYEMDDGSFGSTSDMAKDFIGKLLLKEPGARLTAELCLRHSWIKPENRCQQLLRSHSSINIESFRAFNARRRWKISYRLVSACNRLHRRLRSRAHPRPALADVFVQRECESDHEEDRSPTTLLRRRRSSSS
ncbi:death-associated protein kinase 2-like [Hemitrygon akajei]|uniref:death-associated protein kinase 2-like n=1 Tax=Hemitrygon akajei TaxID=2704970 RepID=UPI003BFA221E